MGFNQINRRGQEIPPLERSTPDCVAPSLHLVSLQPISRPVAVAATAGVADQQKQDRCDREAGADQPL